MTQFNRMTRRRFTDVFTLVHNPAASPLEFFSTTAGFGGASPRNRDGSAQSLALKPLSHNPRNKKLRREFFPAQFKAFILSISFGYGDTT